LGGTRIGEPAYVGRVFQQFADGWPWATLLGGINRFPGLLQGIFRFGRLAVHFQQPNPTACIDSQIDSEFRVMSGERLIEQTGQTEGCLL
jgi:hypothetical protein